KLLEYINTYYLERNGKTKQDVLFAQLPIYLTENGTSIFKESQKSKKEQLNDTTRIQYILGNLGAVQQAVKEGIPIKLYSYWSITDNFEWADAYDSRF